MLRNRFPLAAVLLGPLWIFGCTNSAPTETSTPSEAPAASETDFELGDPGPPPEGQTEPAVDAAAPAEAAPPQTTTSMKPVAENVTVRLMDWDGIQKLVAAKKGKVVVVDLWSTSCGPCRREFPNLVKLHHELGKDVACISVSTDYDGIPSKPAETYLPQVQEFLQEQGATFDNVLCSLSAEELFDKIDLGSVPAVYIYDREGKQVKRFAEPINGAEHTYADHIRPFVESLLTKK